MRALLAFALFGVAGCSALGLDHLSEPHCTSDAQCAVRDRRDGIAEGACVHWQCRDVCVLAPADADDDGALDPMRCTGANGSPRGTDCDDADPLVHPPVATDGGTVAEERCNGADDDCDGAIDEAFVDGAGVMHPGIVPIERARVAAGGGHLSRPSDHAGALSVAVGGDAPTVVRLGVATPAASAFGWAREASDTTLTMPQAITAGCFVRASDGSHQPATCDARELALAETDAHVVALGISTRGCADGQLRLGTWDAVVGLPAIARGPSHRSSTYLGVDLTASGACSGGSRASDVGAARPALSIVDQPSPTAGEREALALAAWLGASFDRPLCGGAAVDVDALGVFVEESTHAATRFSWLTGTDDGAPRVLGRTVGGAAPAIVRFDEDAEPTGWLVGHGDEAGHLALHYVPTVRWSVDDGGTSGVASDPLPTPALDGIRDFTLLTDVAGIDDVAMGLIGAPVAGRVRVGVAYRRGCDASARIELVVLETEAVRPDAVVVIAGPIALDDGASVVRRAHPSVLYVDHGAFRVGAETARGTIDASNDGAIFVAWSEDDARTIVRRVAEIDLAPLDGTIRLPGDAPTLHARGTGAALVARAASDVVDLDLSCTP